MWRGGSHSYSAPGFIIECSITKQDKGFLRFYLPFAFTIIGRRAGKKQGRSGLIHHVSGREVDVGGEGLIFKYVMN